MYFVWNGNRKFNEELLKFEPHNMQAQSLRQLINDRVSQDGLFGMALVGGVVAAAGVILAAVLKRKWNMEMQHRLLFVFRLFEHDVQQVASQYSQEM